MVFGFVWVEGGGEDCAEELGDLAYAVISMYNFL